jgi:hypothetical protein
LGSFVHAWPNGAFGKTGEYDDVEKIKGSMLITVDLLNDLIEQNNSISFFLH